MSIGQRWRDLDPYYRFLISYPLWAIFIFGLFYWGKYWSYSPIGEILDFYQREWIMEALKTLLPNKIVEYDIIINPKYRVIITPECNGLIPYFIFISAIFAYPKRWIEKMKWAVFGFIIFNIANLIRLFIVISTVNIYGHPSFYYIHDLAGNLFLVAIGALMFLLYVKN